MSTCRAAERLRRLSLAQLPWPLSNSDLCESAPPKRLRLPAACQPCALLVVFQSCGSGPGSSTSEFQGALWPQITHRKGTQAAAPDGGRKLLVGFPCMPGTPGCRPRDSKFQGRGLGGEAGRQVEGPVHWSLSKNLRTQEPHLAGAPCPSPTTGFLGLLGQRPGSHLSPLRSDEQSWAQIRTSQVTRPVGGGSGVPPGHPSPVLLPLSAHTPTPTPHALPALQTQGRCSTSGPPAPLIALDPGAPPCSPMATSGRDGRPSTGRARWLLLRCQPPKREAHT